MKGRAELGATDVAREGGQALAGVVEVENVNGVGEVLLDDRCVVGGAVAQHGDAPRLRQAEKTFYNVIKL